MFFSFVFSQLLSTFKHVSGPESFLFSFCAQLYKIVHSACNIAWITLENNAHKAHCCLDEQRNSLHKRHFVITQAVCLHFVTFYRKIKSLVMVMKKALMHKDFSSKGTREN